MDKIVLPDNLQDETPVNGLRDNEEMIILLAKKINEIVEWINNQ